MSRKTELLEFVYQNAKMGEATLPLVIGQVSRPDLRTALSSQLTEYRAIGAEAAAQMYRRGARPRKIGALKSAMAETSLRLNTLTGFSSRHIAEMMIRGSAMGTIQMQKRINACRYSAAPEELALADRLLATEESNIEQMKAFL